MAVVEDVKFFNRVRKPIAEKPENVERYDGHRDNYHDRNVCPKPRSRVTRAEYEAPARQRRAEALEMREMGIAAREIARVLSISVREAYSFLSRVVTSVVPAVQSTSKTTVQGSPPYQTLRATCCLWAIQKALRLR